MRPRVEISPAPGPDDRQIISDALAAYNESKAGPAGYEPVAILLKDETGTTIGGLSGRLTYNWLFVELLFVPERFRGAGLGSDLLDAAETLALSRQCVGVRLDTHDFQAPEFYKARGYTIFGELPDHPRGAKRLFFRKLLQPK
jgi:GNAT superfamily N-acetyltransferase